MSLALIPAEHTRARSLVMGGSPVLQDYFVQELCLGGA